MKINELISLFQTKCPEMVKEMKESNHHYSSEALNFYHQEGDCFTHLCMVMLMGQHFNVNETVALALLCHDLGKPIARQEVHEKQRVRYLGHEGFSVFKAIDCLKKMELSIPEEQMVRILNLVSHHTSLYKAFESKNYIEDIIKKYKGNRSLLEDLIWVSKCDALGRFTGQDNSNVLNIENLLKPALDALDDVKPEIKAGPTATVLCGPPLAGKSTWIKDNLGDAVLISRDDIVMSMAKSSNYATAWKEVDQDAVNKEFNRQREEAIKSRKNIVFDLTNCSPKARRSNFGSLTRDYVKKAVVFYTGYEEIMARNEQRAIEKEKYIRPEVIHQFMMGFMSPLYAEVDVIENVFAK